MDLEFPLYKFRLDITKHRSAEVQLIFNGQLIDGYEVYENQIQKTNTVEIKFTKPDAGDEKSYAVIDKVELNGFDFTDDFKALPYYIDRSMHDHPQEFIPNNLYLGYI